MKRKRSGWFSRLFARREARHAQVGRDAVSRAIEDLVERSLTGEQNATAQLVVLGDAFRAGPDAARAKRQDWGQIKKSYETALRYMQTSPSIVEESSDPFAILTPKPGARFRDSPVGPPLPRGAKDALSAVASFGCDGGAPTVRALASLPSLGGIAGAECAIVLLAQGVMSPEGFSRAREGLPGDDERASFDYAADHPFDAPRDQFGFAGFLYGRAARLKAVREGGHFGLLSPVLAWEMGQ